MAPPASKRRKTDHVSSGDEDDEASFASFGSDESGDEEAPDEVNGLSAEEMDEDAGDEEEDEDEDEDEDPAVNLENVQSRARADKKDKTASQSNPKPARRAKASQPTISTLANGSFKSNVFKLQVDELLGQIRPRHGKRETDAESALHTIKKSIEQIKPRGPFTSVDAERDLIREKVAIPFPNPRPPKDAKYKFAYEKPANVNVVGSYALKTASRSKEFLEIDMVVTMPASLFEDKDYLNHRYFYKRAYYLACIAAGLKTSIGKEQSVRFKLFHDNPLKPILVAKPIGPSRDESNDTPKSKWRINIIPCVTEKQFLAEKLRPDRNCVRSQHQDEVQSPTPFYNSSLRSEMLMTPYLKLLHSASRACESFIDACLLGATWLRQRGFQSSMDSGGFGSFEWNTLMALGLQGGGPNGKPLLSEGYSSYQLFKATLQLLAMKNFTKQPLLLGESQTGPKATADGIPMAWDAVRSHNLLFEVTPWAYKLLRQEARSTITALGDPLHDGFDATFILRVLEPLYRYDCLVEIPAKALSLEPEPRERLIQLHKLLKQGLGDRVTQINLLTQPLDDWALGSSRPLAGIKGNVTIGLVVNADTARRTVDHGPSAENKAETAEFRKFWGEKAELRRFKDGSILESLVWANPESGMSVNEQVIRYTLGHHFGLVAMDDITFSGDFAKLVRGGSDRSSFEPLMAQCKKFENDIRDLHDLPLSIRHILPADPQLRFASVKAPHHGKLAQKPVPADITIQFEGSSRWPDDLVAIQRTKIAFLLKINDLLQDAVDNVTTRIGLENEGQDVLNQAYLDVSYDSDATFRLRIYHEREQGLFERKLKDKTADPKSREIAATGLAKHKRDFVKNPAHTQAIARLCTRHAALSGSIRLTKKWFASHLLSNHIADEVVELLVVRTFTQPWPWQTPSSVQTGFLRTLSWISRWDWRADPLIVDLSASGELKQPQAEAIATNFEAWRKLDPAMNRVALFAASNLDSDGTTWTDGVPAKVVAGRMTALAKAACSEISDKQLRLEPRALFSSPLEDFDMVLHLNPAFAGGKSRRSMGNGAAFKNLELEALTDTDMIGHEPVQEFLKELEDLYGSALLLFYGGTERPVITGLWSPLTARRSWKVNLSYSTIPVKGKDEESDVLADLNKDAVLAEIARLGGDLVEKIEVYKH
ncbi:hypothetical protein M409DRAFT_19946 [Zasmidium cellare ATCC 36951]|uniref:U3 small nucleolar RNA-associated protein 22 n=1 Tax=Zasmidium cellare ATCC 36951 TaxID=1080233 RepID=A0A6A6CS49_ZASCE|nr:uncharacterized protein M409DRAFT_19946 [Zasmidium cellare ATCC 36951]KAF2169533.1 hypothetical protein M409DRAFT_19946 [Zasmidium cellare ATCC 36951]